MAERNVRKHLIPTADDPGDMALLLRRAMYSVNDIIPVRSAAERDQVLATLRAGDFDGPVFVDREDTANWERYPSLDEIGSGSGAWEVMGGRQHGATVIADNPDVTDNTVHGLYVRSFQRASPGFSASGLYNVVVPSTGMYAYSIYATISGAANNLNRCFVELILNDGPTIMRWNSTNEDAFGGTTLQPLSKGDKLKVQAYHYSGGKRTVSITSQIAQINAPRW